MFINEQKRCNENEAIVEIPELNSTENKSEG